LSRSQAFPLVHAYSRKSLPASPTLQTIEASDSASWPSKFPASANPQIFFSALGTTRGLAGGVDKQRTIDYDLNYALAQEAKKAGVSTYVIISSAGADASSLFPYSQMKGQLEDDASKLGFKHVIILRPGIIVGERGSHDSRPAEFALRKVAGWLGSIGLKDAWAQDANVIAKAAVKAGELCLEGKREDGVWIVAQSEIVKLGKE
jgi:uncharacterized protein YbjT (DUF2867 family)